MKTIGKRTNKYLECVADLFIPRTCCMCGCELREFEKSFCTECFASLPFTYFWKYRLNPAKELFKGRVDIEGAIPLMVYKGEIREALHNFKYHGQFGIGEVLGELLGEVISSSPFMQDALKEGITIVPIPLHRRKKRKRGYNQAEIIANGVQKGIDNYMDENKIGKGNNEVEAHLLKREKFTNTQTRLNKLERFKNINDAFGVNEKRLKRYCSKKKCKK